MKIFSPSTQSFYPIEMQADYEAAGTWPADGVEVSEETFSACIAARAAGKVITADADGQPVISDAPPPTAEQLTAAAVAEKARLTVICSYQIGVLTNATDPDVVDNPDPADAALLILWKKYQQALRKVVTTAVPVTWPSLPALASGTDAVSAPQS